MYTLLGIAFAIIMILFFITSGYLLFHNLRIEERLLLFTFRFLVWGLLLGYFAVFQLLILAVISGSSLNTSTKALEISLNTFSFLAIVYTLVIVVRFIIKALKNVKNNNLGGLNK